MGSNIGGRAKRLEMRMQDYHEALDRQWTDGYEEGRKATLDALRDEIRTELQDEVERFDPNCPLCLGTKTLANLSQEHEFLKQRFRELHAKTQGWAIRKF